jgi:hypothetical protein
MNKADRRAVEVAEMKFLRCVVGICVKTNYAITIFDRNFRLK